MITIEEGLIYKLQNTTGVTNLVSTRVYNMRIPESATLPCVTIQRISTPRVHTHDSSGLTGTAHPRFQVDSYATTQTSAKAINDAIITALNGAHGTFGTGGSTVTVQAILVDDEDTEFVPDVNLYRQRADFIVWHLEG